MATPSGWLAGGRPRGRGGGCASRSSTASCTSTASRRPTRRRRTSSREQAIVIRVGYRRGRGGREGAGRRPSTLPRRGPGGPGAPCGRAAPAGAPGRADGRPRRRAGLRGAPAALPQRRRRRALARGGAAAARRARGGAGRARALGLARRARRAHRRAARASAGGSATRPTWRSTGGLDDADAIDDVVHVLSRVEAALRARTAAGFDLQPCARRGLTPFAARRSDERSAARRQAVEQLTDLAEARAQLRVAHLDREHRVLQLGDQVVGLAGGVRGLLDEHLRPLRGDAGSCGLEGARLQVGSARRSRRRCASRARRPSAPVRTALPRDGRRWSRRGARTPRPARRAQARSGRSPPRARRAAAVAPRRSCRPSTPGIYPQSGRS